MAIGDAYVVSIYWAVTTMSTIGYGDIKPTNTAERLFAMFVMFVGAGIFTYGITNVVTAVATSNKAALEFRERLDALNVYMEAMQIPTHLRRRLRTYFQHLEQTSLIFRESHLLADVSPELQTSQCAPAARGAADRASTAPRRSHPSPTAAPTTIMGRREAASRRRRGGGATRRMMYSSS